MLGPGVLQVVMKPSYCALLKAFGYDQFAILAEYCGVFDQLVGITFLFSIVFEVFVILLCLGCLFDSEGIEGVLFGSIGKHKVHGFLDVGCGCFMLLCGVVFTPALSKSHSH